MNGAASKADALPAPAHSYRAETLLLHSDYGIEQTADVSPPIHLTTTYETNHPLGHGMSYSRTDHITRHRVEAILVAIEKGAKYCVSYASGQAATTAVFAALKPTIIFAHLGYFGSKIALENYIAGQAVAGSVRRMSDTEMDAIISAMNADAPPPQTVSLIWLESPNNPYCSLYDITLFARIAKYTGARLVVDATLSSPLGSSPLLDGADVVMHSCTKYIGGHSDVLAGALLTKDEFVAKTLYDQRVVNGAGAAPFDSFLVLRSLRTLTLRVNTQSSSALTLCRWLEQHRTNNKKSPLTAVHHCALPSHPSYVLYERLLKLAPATFSIVLHTEAEAKRLCSLLRLFRSATSLGACESLIDWRFPYDQTLSPALLRVSVGLEHVDDLIDDFQQAFNTIMQQATTQ